MQVRYLCFSHELVCILINAHPKVLLSSISKLILKSITIDIIFFFKFSLISAI